MERQKAKEKYENLKKDRELFTVKAPDAGVVYYGKCVQGNWTGTPAKLQKGGTIMGEEVFMTIVKPGPMIIRGSVDEKDSRHLAVDNPCRITTPAFPDAKITGSIDKVGTVPVGGNYEVRAKVNPTDVGVIPGMTAQVKVTTYEKKDALTLPMGVVFTDEGDEDKPYVYKAGANGKPEKVFVKIGKKAGGKAEILSGLSEGDEVLKEKPGKE
jgi:multidrug efflux pump subunit AcrA (membrane-fusion protein)